MHVSLNLQDIRFVFVIITAYPTIGVDQGCGHWLIDVSFCGHVEKPLPGATHRLPRAGTGVKSALTAISGRAFWSVCF